MAVGIDMRLACTIISEGMFRKAPFYCGEHALARTKIDTVHKIALIRKRSLLVNCLVRRLIQDEKASA